MHRSCDYGSSSCKAQSHATDAHHEHCNHEEPTHYAHAHRNDHGGSDARCARNGTDPNPVLAIRVSVPRVWGQPLAVVDVARSNYPLVTRVTVTGPPHRAGASPDNPRVEQPSADWGRGHCRRNFELHLGDV
eukprot:CAMPEP_0174308672 /NCGR_PEP_ID=MMETSP0810-20121108/1909_1 /TAXON_ID=73025 ORGANISM="Eutreptiella gymnastica-like, Strain CCMP1594" /NCGR_SAMPLE_ID=MMETSP0810 /ASSEMBLY_ACC=CAM_ASM_000659 /LENGTH=131 /DNA_ID=CAMNT_0015416069 /DNA_START=443 /DNA_END=838 /DNA_ORIENTATION=+